MCVCVCNTAFVFLPSLACGCGQCKGCGFHAHSTNTFPKSRHPRSHWHIFLLHATHDLRVFGKVVARTPMHENKDALDQDLPEFDRQLSIQLIRTIDDGIQIDAHNVPRGPLIALSVRTSEFVTKQTQKSSRKSETRPARIKPPTAKRQSCGRISTEAIRAVMELCGK